MTEAQLKSEFHSLKCETFFDSGTKALYATDSSNYRQVPIGVVKPRSDDDILETLAICRRLELPVLSRGGGTSLAGQCCNTAIVMDMSPHYNRILEINAQEKYAVVQPGLVLDDLRNAAKEHGLTFGPDPSTHNRCTLGGMIGNNSCGVHALMAGKTEENVHELDIVTYDGTQMLAKKTSAEELKTALMHPGREGEILSRLKKLGEKYADEIRRRFPNIPRRVSGYNLPELLPENQFHIARALVGTESTCATVLKAKVRLVHDPKHRCLVVIGFLELWASGHAIPQILKHNPIGLEGIDHFLVENIRTKHMSESSLDWMPNGNAWLIVELGDDDKDQLLVRAEALKKEARHYEEFKDVKLVTDKDGQDHIWKVRESGLGATAYVPGQADTWEGWEDSAVPPDKVGDYLRDLNKLYAKFGYRGALYGHFGQGCIHTRINFDLVTADGIQKYRSFIGEAAELVHEYGGSLSGEHGDGQSKAEFLGVMFGSEIVKAFAEFKDIWDPLNRMNPGKVVRPFKNTQNLRLGTQYAPWEPKTLFHFPEDHGAFSRAALRCVGVGLCRREGGGVMCPSYQVTHDEKHSTRGRAHLLFEMLRGETVTAKWNSPEVKDALDLCLACKGCKGDCPVNVDMATYKSEFLAHYYKTHFRPRSAFAMGQIMNVARVAGLMPGLTNLIMRAPGLGSLAKKFAGISTAREMPAFARATFRSRFKPTRSMGSPVILWTDTFTNYFEPAIAASAQRVLEAAGFSVSIPDKPYCCGRPLYDYGFVSQAQRRLKKILNGMREPIRAGVPIVFMEPSCASVFRDELKNLFPHDQDANRLSKQSFMIGEFLVQRAPEFEWPQVTRPALVQGHCHHKSVLDFACDEEALKKMHVNANVLSSGCCGMAGSFGFEAKHFDISQAIGERAVLPAFRQAGKDTLLIANGFSCREQIRQGTGHRPLHLAQVIDEFLREGKPQ